MKKISLPIYDFTIQLCVDNKELNRLCKKNKLEMIDFRKCAGVTYFEEDKKNFIVGLFDKEITTSSHEANHVVIQIFEYIGININHENSEAYCYFHDYILEIFINFQINGNKKLDLLK